MTLKLNEPKNKNYAANIVRPRVSVPLDGLDNLVAIPLLGYQALVSKNTVLNELMVLFTAESQLSLEYASENNLHRHSDLNKNEAEAGYLEDSRRVKAIKLRGHRSDALLMPLSSLAFTGAKLNELQEGDILDVLNGHDIVKKYYVKEPGTNRRVDKNAVPKFRRVDEIFLPLHFDTDSYFRNSNAIPDDAEIVVTQKLHGTSVRIANTIVKRKLNWKERLAKKLGVKVAETEFDHVYGSRRVIKDPNNPDQKHFYDSSGDDVWTLNGRKIDTLVPENYVLYGELIGWTPEGQPLQKNYTYDVPGGEAHLYIYRVAIVTNGGLLIDLNWDQVKDFTNLSGLKHVPELWRGKHSDFDANNWIDINFDWHGVRDKYITFSTNETPVPLSDKNTVDEGVVVMTYVGRAPYFLKAKSPKFLEHETKILDQGIVDIETEGSEEES